MIPGRHNMVLRQGGTYEETWTLRDKETGDAIDLTGWTIRMKAKSLVDGTTIISHNTASPPSGLSVSGNVITYRETAAFTAALQAAKFPLAWDIERAKTESGEEVCYPFLEGQIELSTEKTN